METYSETRVVMSPNGELLLALPIYTSSNSAIFGKKDLSELIGTDGLSIGIYEDLGYLMYHPNQDFSFYIKTLKLFEDLGLLGGDGELSWEEEDDI